MRLYHTFLYFPRVWLFVVIFCFLILHFFRFYVVMFPPFSKSWVVFCFNLLLLFQVPMSFLPMSGCILAKWCLLQISGIFFNFMLIDIELFQVTFVSGSYRF